MQYPATKSDFIAIIPNAVERNEISYNKRQFYATEIGGAKEMQYNVTQCDQHNVMELYVAKLHAASQCNILLSKVISLQLSQMQWNIMKYHTIKGSFMQPKLVEQKKCSTT